MTMDIYDSLLSLTVNICVRMLLLLMFLATPPPDIQHLRALAMVLCIDCTIGDRENMLIGRNVYATVVAHPHAFFLITSQTRDSFTGM